MTAVVRWSYAAGFAVCVAAGLLFGVLFALGATVILVVEGMGDTEGITYWSGIALNFAGFGVAGILAGLLNPLARSWAGAVLLGVIVTIPLAWVATVYHTGDMIPQSDYRFVIVLFSLLFGGGTGYLVRRQFSA